MLVAELAVNTLHINNITVSAVLSLHFDYFSDQDVTA
jgi:hypothetical protein